MIEQKTTIKGEHYFFNVSKQIKEGTEKFAEVKQAIDDFVQKGNRFLLDKLIKARDILNFTKKENLIATAGRATLASILAGAGEFTGEITYGAIGTGTTPFTNASTQLTAEAFRKVPSSSSYDGNIAYIDFFIASADVADGTYEEWGTFIDGTATADTGEAFSLLITGGWVKSGSIFISCKYTIN